MWLRRLRCIALLLFAAMASDECATPRLILTSSGLSRKLREEFLRMLGPTEDKSVWYIPTAAVHEGGGDGMIRAQLAELRHLGISNVKVIDPEHVQGDSLKKALAALGRVDVVWAEMGNTYALRHHLRKSGGDQLVREALAAGAIYVGASAGSIVAGRTVQMAFWKDWDDRTADGTIDVDWKDPELGAGLDLAKGRSFFPHANGPYARKSWQEEQARKHGHDHEVVILADGQGFVMEGDKAYVV